MRALRSYGLPFLFFAPPFGVLFGLFTGLTNRSAAEGLLAGLVVGAVAGGLFALVIGTLQYTGNRDAAPGRPTGPTQAVTIPVRPGADLADRIRAALLSLPAELRTADVPAGRYVARTGTTWRSFGEHVTVQLTGHPAAPMAEITSRPVVRTTLIDYGKGRRNVDQVAAGLHR